MRRRGILSTAIVFLLAASPLITAAVDPLFQLVIAVTAASCCFGLLFVLGRFSFLKAAPSSVKTLVSVLVCMFVLSATEAYVMHVRHTSMHGRRGGAFPEGGAYCISECAKCGRVCYTEYRAGKCTKMVFEDNDVSQWLCQRDPTLTSCSHDWIPACGWSSSNNLSWDSFGTTQGRILRRIKELDSTLDHDAIKGMLDRYYAISGVRDGEEKYRRLKEFHQELMKPGKPGGKPGTGGS